jgi:hypothetical protein
MNDIDESDWKLLQEIKAVALERLCERILQQIATQCDLKGETSLHRFLKAFSLIDRGNADIARAFDDLRRSNARQRLRTMISLNLISDEELLGFSSELRKQLGPIQDKGA